MSSTNLIFPLADSDKLPIKPSNVSSEEAYDTPFCMIMQFLDKK